MIMIGFLPVLKTLYLFNKFKSSDNSYSDQKN